MKNTFLFLVAFLLSFNSFSQYVVTRTDTIFGNVIGMEDDGYDKKAKKNTYCILVEDSTIKRVSIDSITAITNFKINDKTKKVAELIEAYNLFIIEKTNNNTMGQELIKYGKLNNIASGLEVVGYVFTGVGGVTLNPPIMIVGGVVYLVSWIVRTSSYRHVIEAGKISDGYYKNSRKPIQIIQ